MRLRQGFAWGLALLATFAVPCSLRASNGDLRFLAEVDIGNSGQTRLCNYWELKHGGNNSCQAPVFDVYVDLQGLSVNGITGVEFAATIGPDNGPDPGYILVEIPNLSATTILGSAFTPPDPSPRGLNMAWSSCQTGDAAGRVPVATVIVFPTQICGPGQQPSQIVFEGAQHSSPSNVFFLCPLVTLCDAPVFTKVCLGSNITTCQTPVPPFPDASMCSTSGSFAVNPDPGSKECMDSLQTGDVLGSPAVEAENLRGDLISAIASLYEGNTGSTCDRIRAVVDEIGASMLSGSIEAQHGTILIDAANGARSKIGCSAN